MSAYSGLTLSRPPRQHNLLDLSMQTGTVKRQDSTDVASRVQPGSTCISCLGTSCRNSAAVILNRPRLTSPPNSCVHLLFGGLISSLITCIVLTLVKVLFTVQVGHTSLASRTMTLCTSNMRHDHASMSETEGASVGTLRKQHVQHSASQPCRESGHWRIKSSD